MLTFLSFGHPLPLATCRPGCPSAPGLVPPSRLLLRRRLSPPPLRLRGCRRPVSDRKGSLRTDRFLANFKSALLLVASERLGVGIINAII